MTSCCYPLLMCDMSKIKKCQIEILNIIALSITYHLMGHFVGDCHRPIFHARRYVLPIILRVILKSHVLILCYEIAINLISCALLLSCIVILCMNIGPLLVISFVIPFHMLGCVKRGLLLIVHLSSHLAC
jgi:hypothetical protein